ncbi:hypothetical protein HAX54_004277 [Datura stramonium]|uniref:Uncharacterized protein n=1 Tax=Datura stramonium TaxID=4076 RepID=A0ABS8T7G1_DATST|nr:hypothetical protein [Datura stramonium]
MRDAHSAPFAGAIPDSQKRSHRRRNIHRGVAQAHISGPSSIEVPSQEQKHRS